MPHPVWSWERWVLLRLNTVNVEKAQSVVYEEDFASARCFVASNRKYIPSAAILTG